MYWCHTYYNTGDLTSMRLAEKKALCEYLNDESAGGDEEAEAGNELGEQQTSLDKENATTSSAIKKRGRKRKALKEIQARIKMMWFYIAACIIVPILIL